MLKKPHLSDCCFNPTYHDWLGRERETERERDREKEREREREGWCPQQKRVEWVRVAGESG